LSLPPGVSIRPIDPTADLATVVGLQAACDVADVGEPDLPAEWLVEAWRGPAFGGAWLAERDGTALAYLELEWRRTTRGVEAFVPVLPEERDGSLRAALVAEAEARARSLVPGLEWMRVVGAATDPTFARDCRAAGYTEIRTFWHMERAIDPPPASEPLPDGVTIRSSTGPEDDPELHRILEAAFVGHFGNVPTSLGDWRDEHASMLRDRELVLVASAEDEPAGVVTLEVPDGAGWVVELGVLPGFRGRGIGRALLLAGLGVLASRGASIARLNVDGENGTGATRLYASVGMHVRRVFTLYEKPIRPAE
jgi:mycothiol synthase